MLGHVYPKWHPKTPSETWTLVTDLLYWELLKKTQVKWMNDWKSKRSGILRRVNYRGATDESKEVWYLSLQGPELDIETVGLTEFWVAYNKFGKSDQPIQSPKEVHSD
jgi:hypothetical protein